MFIFTLFFKPGKNGKKSELFTEYSYQGYSRLIGYLKCLKFVLFWPSKNSQTERRVRYKLYRMVKNLKMNIISLFFLTSV